MNPTTVAPPVFYYVLVLGVSFRVARKGASTNLEGYILGGRKLGLLVTVLTLQSTLMSGPC